MHSPRQTEERPFERTRASGGRPGARRIIGALIFAGLCAVLFASGETLSAAETTGEGDARATAIAELRATYPGLIVSFDAHGRTIATGAPMAEAESAHRAIDLWLERHSAALAIDPATLELISATDLSDRRASVFAFRPRASIAEGVHAAIEGGAVRFLVRSRLEDASKRLRFHVTHAAAHTALEPRGGYPPMTIPAEQSETIARLALPSSAQSIFSPRLVIAPSATTGRESVLAWHVSATGVEGAWTVRVDPTTGVVLEVRNELLDVDVHGSVEGLVSPAPRPDLPSNPPASVPLVGIEVGIVGGAKTRTAVDGSFVLPHGGTAPVDVEVSLVGDWVTIEDLAAPELVVSETVTPPGNTTIVLDAMGDEFIQAQVNGFHYTTRTHDFFRARTLDGVPGIDQSLPCRVNLNDTCNATYDPVAVRMNFFVAGDGCANSAFANVISHEYGHFVVHQLGLAQGAFGEGFGDVVAMLLDDDPIIGRDFNGLGTAVRDPVAADLQYPCAGSVHFCGQLLGAVWWKIREQLGLFAGSAAGLEETRQLFVDWSLITIGGEVGSSAHPATALEVLAVDDDDGFIENGTPRFLAICAAFAEHSIDCPPFPPISFSYPLGVPTRFSPVQSTTVQVEVTDGTETHVPSSLRLHLRQGGAGGSGAFAEHAATALGGGIYAFDLPPMPCGDPIEWAITVEAAAGAEFASPIAGTLTPHRAAVFETLTPFETDAFEGESGWTVGDPADDASAGLWERVVPLGTAAAPGADHSDPGTACFVTGQGQPTDPLGTHDVDGGVTTLRSPIFDLGGADDFEIGYWRWFSNEVGSAPQSDVFDVEISNDGGATWHLVERVGPTGIEASGGWYEHRFAVSSILEPTAVTQLRFRAFDLGVGSLVEAAIDDFEIRRRDCASVLVPRFLRGDTNLDLDLTLGDVIGLLTYMFAAGDLSCLDAGDVNDSGELTLSDAIGLLGYLFAGGPEFPPPFGICGIDPTGDVIDCASGALCP